MNILLILGWVLSIATSLFLAKSAFDKVRGTEEMIGNFAYMKLEKYRALTGYGELLGAVLLLVPMTSLFGMIIITSFMSAAAVMHLSAMGGTKVQFPIGVGLTALIGFLLRTL